MIYSEFPILNDFFLCVCGRREFFYGRILLSQLNKNMVFSEFVAPLLGKTIMNYIFNISRLINLSLSIEIQVYLFCEIDFCKN